MNGKKKQVQVIKTFAVCLYVCVSPCPLCPCGCGNVDVDVDVYVPPALPASWRCLIRLVIQGWGEEKCSPLADKFINGFSSLDL